MDQSLITTIIKKFLEGDCSDEELAYLLYWYESFDEQDDLPLNEEEKQMLRNKILARIQHNIPALKSLSDTRTQQNHIRIRRLLRYAVAASLILMIAWTGFRYYRQGPISGSAAQNYSATKSDEEPTWFGLYKQYFRHIGIFLNQNVDEHKKRQSIHTKWRAILNENRGRGILRFSNRFFHKLIIVFVQINNASFKPYL